MMKAAVYTSYGSPEVLMIEEVERPAIQAGHDDRVLIEVHSASINPNDSLYRQGFLPIRLDNGIVKPKQQILGIDVAGTVVAVGQNVSRFKAGDRVFGNCWGSHAEYVRVREKSIALMPSRLTFDEAAAIPTVALTALQGLRDAAQIKAGQRALIYGASGGVGHMAVQLAKYFEAEVTAVCSTSNVAWVKDLGADEVIDYTEEDFAQNGRQYDVILDAVGKRTYFSCRRALSDTGVYVTVQPLAPKFQAAQLLLSKLIGDKRGKAFLSKTNAQDMDLLRELAEAEKLRPVIERRYPLEQIAAAYRHVENGHTKGKVIISVRSDG